MFLSHRLILARLNPRKTQQMAKKTPPKRELREPSIDLIVNIEYYKGSMQRKTAVILMLLGYAASVAHGSLGVYLCVTEDGSFRTETIWDNGCIPSTAVSDQTNFKASVDRCGECSDYLLSSSDAVRNRIENSISSVTLLAILPQKIVFEFNNHQMPRPTINSPNSLPPITSAVLTI